jgi:hypothetical protein
MHYPAFTPAHHRPIPVEFLLSLGIVCRPSVLTLPSI